jgi:membrane-associated phospholipid phosphatase
MRRPVKSPLLAAAACLAAFMAVFGCAHAIGPVGRLDAIALHGLMTLDTQMSDPIGYVIAHSADPAPLAAMLGVLFALGWALGRRREAVAAVALVGGANITAQALKILVAHPRFYSVLGTDQVGAAAFPSGHATASMSIALAAVLVAPPRVRIAVAAGAAAYAIAVSTSILVLGWHFPSDVLGGMLLASGFFFCAVAALRASATGVADVAARAGAGLVLVRRLGEAAVVGLAGAALVALVSAGGLLAFARVNTTATAAALAVAAAAAGLLAAATVAADR